MNGYPLKITGFTIQGKMKSTAGEIAPDDNILVERTLKGRTDSFRKLVDRYRNQAFLFARAMVGNSDDAYDLSQDAFVRVHRHLKRFDPTYSFKTWFFHILANLCKNHLRHRKIKVRYTSPLDAVGPVSAPAVERPDISFERDETQKAIWISINLLPEKFREIIVLSHFQEMSYEQMAKVLGIPRGSVMSRLYYARQKLREILEKRGVTL